MVLYKFYHCILLYIKKGMLTYYPTHSTAFSLKQFKAFWSTIHTFFNRSDWCNLKNFNRSKALLLTYNSTKLPILCRCAVKQLHTNSSVSMNACTIHCVVIGWALGRQGRPQLVAAEQSVRPPADKAVDNAIYNVTHTYCSQAASFQHSGCKPAKCRQFSCRAYQQECRGHFCTSSWQPRNELALPGTDCQLNAHTKLVSTFSTNRSKKYVICQTVSIST